LQVEGVKELTRMFAVEAQALLAVSLEGAGGLIMLTIGGITAWAAATARRS